MSVAGVILKATAEFVGEVFAALMTSLERLFAPDPPRVRGPTLDSLGEPKPVVPLLPPAPTPHVTPRLKLELLVEVGPTVGVAPSLLLKVRGGPLVADTVRLVYVVTGSFMEKGRPHELGDSSSISDPPAPFRGVCQLPQKLDNSNNWILLRSVYQDAIIPPRRGVQSCQFSCQVFLRGGEDTFGTPRTIGAAMQTATYSVSLDFNCLGYLDEREWVSLRIDGLALLLVILDGCEVEKPSKSQKLKAWVQGLALPSKSTERQRAITQRLFDQYLNGLSSGIGPSLVRQHEVIGELSRCKDYEFQRKVALLAVQLVGGESKHGLGRSLCAKITDAFSGALYSLPRQDLEPAPPLAPVPAVQPIPPQVIPPVPVVSPAAPPAPATASPAVPSFELKLEPIEEAGRVKAAEVHVRGFFEGLLMPQPELTYWLWDESAGDEPFLVSSADIDQVHESAVHHHTWKKDEYDPSKWQSAGVVRFNRFMPPAGGSRRISVAARTGAKMIIGFFNPQKTARSTAVVMPIACPGYRTIRNARHGLRCRAFVVAVGLALMSGKGPTYRQDKALKKFAQTLCAGITNRKLAEGYQNDLLTLLDSNVDDSLYGLTNQLDHLADQAYPELKPQLLEALVEVMASRKARSKQSRYFLEYSRSVLA